MHVTPIQRTASVATTQSLSQDPRASLLMLPRFLQGLLTLLTGKPYPGQAPLFWRTPLWHLAMALLSFGMGGVTSTWIIQHGEPLLWPLLIFPWMLTVSGARRPQVEINHQCVHGNFSKIVWLDRLLAEVVSTLLLIQDAAGYWYDHAVLHHGKRFATLDDPDVRFLLTLGFCPGIPVADLWRLLWWTLISPHFHWLFLRARLRANFTTAQPWRRLLAMGYLIMVLSIVALTNAWLVLLVAWVIPVFFLYHIAALLQFVCEHYWLAHKDPSLPGSIVLARLTPTRFMGEAAPVRDLPLRRALRAWTWWTVRTLCLHTPARLCIVVLDLSQHSFHHLHRKGQAWTNAIYLRQQHVEQGYPGCAEPGVEIWGLGSAINTAFHHLSVLPPLPAEYKPLTRSEAAAVIHGM